MEDEFAAGAAGVEVLGEPLEGDAGVVEVADRVDEVLEAAAEPVEAPHHAGVAFAERCSSLRPACSFRGDAAGVVLVDLLAGGSAQRVTLDLFFVVSTRSSFKTMGIARGSAPGMKERMRKWYRESGIAWMVRRSGSLLVFQPDIA